MTAQVIQLFPPTTEESAQQELRNAAEAILQNSIPVTMEIPGLNPLNVNTALQGLDDFTQKLSLEEQKRWEIWVPRDPRFDEPDDGAIRKEPPADWKLFFHYRHDLEQLLLSKKQIVLEDWQRKWFGHMDQILKVCTEAFLKFCVELDYLYPGFQFEKRARLAQHLNVLRSLRYEPHTGTLAKCHTDRCALTFAIAESSPGLRFERGRNVFEQEHQRTPRVIAFPGDQFAEITRDTVARWWHAVVDKSNGQEVRFSMVFFGKFFLGAL